MRGLTDIAAIVAEKNDIPVSKAKNIIRSTLEVISDSLKEGEDVAFKGFATFKVTDKPEKKTVSFGKEVVIPAHRAVKISASKQLKDSIR